LVTTQRIGRNASEWILCHGGGISSLSLFRAEGLRRLGGFNEALHTGEDMDLFFRLSLHGSWRHVPGQPITMRIGHGHSADRAESNLNRRFLDNHRQWVRVSEDLILRHGGKRVIPRRVYGRVLSRRWNLAGKELLRAGLAEDARACFIRAAQWRWWNFAWLKNMITYWRSAA
jgi:hypothetical protein